MIRQAPLLYRETNIFYGQDPATLPTISTTVKWQCSGYKKNMKSYSNILD